MSAHAFLPPSGAGAWVHCAAWPAMNARYPQGDDEKTLEGTAAHWVFGEIFECRVVAEGQIAPNNVVVTDEMLDAAQLFVDAVDERLAAYGMTRRDLVVERRVQIPRVHPHNWGTPDLWFYARSHGVLEVFDFKFGHAYVDEYENWQLIDYVAGIASELGMDGVSDQHTRARLTVVQPRCYSARSSVRSWAVMLSDLRGHINKLRNAAESATGHAPKATTGDHCEYCPGRHACGALQSAAYAAAEKSTDGTPVELTPAAAALELRMLERAKRRLDARVKGLAESVESMLRRGQPVPFYRMETSAGRETWAKPADEVLALGAVFKVNLAKPATLTPKQAVKAGLPEAVVAAYVTRPTGATKLVEVVSSDAARVFS